VRRVILVVRVGTVSQRCSGASPTQIEAVKGKILGVLLKQRGSQRDGTPTAYYRHYQAYNGGDQRT